MFDFFDFMLSCGYERAKIERKKQEENGEVLNTKVNDYTIDSCYTFDAGYETAICKGDNYWIIVNNPAKIYSVQNKKVENFR